MRGSESKQERQYLARQDVCEEERAEPIPLTRYMDDARSATELVDGCEDTEDLPKWEKALFLAMRED
jgi:hypothetical protein